MSSCPTDTPSRDNYILRRIIRTLAEQEHLNTLCLPDGLTQQLPNTCSTCTRNTCTRICHCSTTSNTSTLQNTTAVHLQNTIEIETELGRRVLQLQSMIMAKMRQKRKTSELQKTVKNKKAKH